MYAFEDASTSEKVDKWLDGIGYYRKYIGYDDSCLFRAAAEQLYDIQIYHERVRKECIDYAQQNSALFVSFFSNLNQFCNYLDKLKNHLVVPGKVELRMLSLKYNCDVMIFDALKMCVEDFSKLGSPNKALLMCKMPNDHFDVVYQKDYIQDAGFTQSIAYGILYEQVFGMDNVSATVQSMLNEKPNPYTVYDQFSSTAEEKEKEEKVDSIPAPFPFKIAKALDPNIYRNIEYDTWIEVRKDIRYEEWYRGGAALTRGTKCIVRYEGEDWECYIQSKKDTSECEVYILKLGAKAVVDYAMLRPEEDAKPWPMPFRLNKKAFVTNELDGTEAGAAECKSLRKRRENKNRRIKSLSESGGYAMIKQEDLLGCPLQMKDLRLAMPSTNASDDNNNTDFEMPEDQNTGDCKGTQDTSPRNWCSVPVDDDQSLAYTSAQNEINPNTGWKSAPVLLFDNTPPEPVYYTINEPVHHPRPTWHAPPQFALPPTPEAALPPPQPEPHTPVTHIPVPYPYYPMPTALYTPTTPEPVPLFQPLYPPSTPTTVYYSPVIPPSPVSPPHQATADCRGVPTAAINPVYHGAGGEYLGQGQFLPPSPYMQPMPTPPTAWYYPHVGSQGFVFPPQAGNAAPRV